MRLRSSIAILVLTLATSVAAQPTGAGEAAYREGRHYYDLRDWDKAIASFKEAYRIRSDAASLFNIAQSYRLKGDCVEALGFYRTYKRNFPNATNLDRVDAFIAELEPCAKQRAAAPPASPPSNDSPPTTTTAPSAPTTAGSPSPITTPAPDGPPPVEPVPPPARSRRGKRTAGLVLGGAGVVIAGSGFVFGALAKSKSDEVTNGGDTKTPPTFDPEIQDQGRRYDLLAKVAWGAGSAAIIGGVVLYFVAGNDKEARISVAPTPIGTMVSWSMRFQ
jgi:tetratricopeptide (TPR) repeat protein